jgi:hypothetical protein
VKRQILRNSLLVCLFLSSAFAAWSWFRPYAWRPDPAARCKIVETLVTRDQSYFWVDVRLKVTPGMTHDLQKPARLETATGATHEPADLAGPLTLHLNDGKLLIKTRNAVPELATSTYKNFTTNQW